jgi:ferredoxin
MKRFLSHADLTSLVAELTAANTRVIAPVRASDNPAQIDYRPITKLDEATFGVQLPRLSLKELFLPPSEVLLQYRQTANGVEIQEVPTKAAPQVIFGATPCDTAGLEVVDKVMNWDYRDELWFGRRDATTIVSFLCSAMDSTCFCTAVGLGPDSFRGSDVLLTPVEGGYVAEVTSFKGEALLKNFAVAEPDAAVVAEAETAATVAHQKVEENLPAISSEFPDWLAKNFDNPIWKTLSLRCHGCGACASVCPTCHCFDIADEHDSSEQGVRRRNWDSCQTSQFTLHASGHNPRATQIERFRQRIMHKFSIYPRRFEEILCTGCGRCARICPGGMDLPEIISELTALAEAESERNAQ